MNLGKQCTSVRFKLVISLVAIFMTLGRRPSTVSALERVSIRDSFHGGLNALSSSPRFPQALNNGGT